MMGYEFEKGQSVFVSYKGLKEIGVVVDISVEEFTELYKVRIKNDLVFITVNSNYLKAEEILLNE